MTFFPVNMTRVTHEREFSAGWLAAKAGMPEVARESDARLDGRRAFKHAEATGRDPRWTRRIGERKRAPLDWGKSGATCEEYPT